MKKRAEQLTIWFVYSLLIFFWPINFVLNSSLQDTIHFFLPSLLLAAALGIFQNYSLRFIALVSLIPLINSSLLFIPAIGLFFADRKVAYFLIGFLMVFICYFSWKPFIGSSIFYYEHNDQQKIIWQGYVYPHRYLARLFQNKPSIYIERFLFNFFALTDIGNYFFGYQPRPIVGNQNLQKFPFLALPVFIIGIYQCFIKRKKLVMSLGFVVLNLSLLKYFDKTDAILWLPLVMIMAVGLKKLMDISFYLKLGLSGIFIIFALAEYLHLFVNISTR